MGRPFSLNSLFFEDSSNTSSQKLADTDLRRTPVYGSQDEDELEEVQKREEYEDPEGDPQKLIPMTSHALKKWNETKTIHCFQTLTNVQMLLERQERNQLTKFCNGHVPAVKFVYAIKQRNMGKLDTHRHFFTGFCQDLHPIYCSLIDVGTTFDDHTYFGYIQMGELRAMLGGISQEVEVMWQWKPMVICQFMDYKLDVILKSAEGLYGLVQILPGAHQFLKWRGVRGKALDIYIKGTEDKNYEERKDTLGIFKRNVFLTEDKLMTALLVLRSDQVHTVEYLPGPRAYTDVPTTTSAIMRQRRRWLNGGFSTTLYSMSIYCKQYGRSQLRQKHPCIGFMLFLQLLYHLLQIFVQTTIALDVITSYRFLFLFEQEIQDETLMPGLDGFGVLNVSFFTLMAVVFFISFCCSSRKQTVTTIYEIISYLLMIINIFKLAGIIIIIYQSFTGQNTAEGELTLLMGIISVYFFLLNFIVLFCIKPGQVCRKCPKFLISLLFYLLFQNTFFLMVKLYLVCNYHDVSWGSRTGDKKAESKIHRRYMCSTLLIILAWLILNGILIYLIEFFPLKSYVIFGMGVLVFIWITVRAVQALIYWIRYCSKYRFKLYGNNLKPKYQGTDRGNRKIRLKHDRSTHQQTPEYNLTKHKVHEHSPTKAKDIIIRMKKQRGRDSQQMFKNQEEDEVSSSSSSDSKSENSKIQKQKSSKTQKSKSQRSSKQQARLEKTLHLNSGSQPSKSDEFQELKASFTVSSGFYSNKSQSVNVQQKSQIASKLSFDGTLWGKDSLILGSSSRQNPSLLKNKQSVLNQNKQSDRVQNGSVLSLEGSLGGKESVIPTGQERQNPTLLQNQKSIVNKPFDRAQNASNLSFEGSFRSKDSVIPTGQLRQNPSLLKKSTVNGDRSFDRTQSASNLSFDGTLWGKDSIIPSGQQRQNPSLLRNKESALQAEKQLNRSQDQSFWEKTSSLPSGQDLRSNSRSTPSSSSASASKAELSHLNFTGDQSLWDKGSELKEKESNQFWSSFSSSSQQNTPTYRPSSASFVEKRGTPTATPQLSVRSQHRSTKFRQSLESIDKIPEDDEEYSEEEKKQEQIKEEEDDSDDPVSEGVEEVLQRNIPSFNDKDSKSSSDLFKNSQQSSSGFLSTKKSEIYQDPLKTASNNSDTLRKAFVVKGSTVEDGVTSGRTTLKKVSPFPSKRSGRQI